MGREALTFFHCLRSFSPISGRGGGDKNSSGGRPERLTQAAPGLGSGLLLLLGLLLCCCRRPVLQLIAIQFLRRHEADVGIGFPVVSRYLSSVMPSCAQQLQQPLFIALACADQVAGEPMGCDTVTNAYLSVGH